MALPFDPPLPPMLAKLRDEIPEGPGWTYEPKWDGFRAVVFKDGPSVHIASRDSRPLERYFPELLDVLDKGVPERCVIDGEVIIPSPAGLDFDALLQRIHPAASRVKLLASETPASFVVFDLLAIDDDDLRDAPLSQRREHLRAAFGEAADATAHDALAAARGQGPRVTVTPHTEDRPGAVAWFDLFEGAGLDGIVAKQLDGPYVPGERIWLKIKHKRTADCIVGGYRLSKAGDGIGSLLLGLYDDHGVLAYVGHTSSFKAPERRKLLAELRPLEGGESFGGARAPGGPSRWTGGRDTSWVPLEPRLVCEVTFDHLQGHRFRHATTFLRWRTDKAPADCTFAQLEPPRS